MKLKEWNELPDELRNESVKKYYDILYKKRNILYFKRIFDIAAAVVLFVFLLPILLFISIAIKIDSKGPIIFCQLRVTQYGKIFKIHKFRSMIDSSGRSELQITVKNDTRVTDVGRFLRKYRLDEIPQLLNIILGDMSFVGTRPEVVKYVEKYNDEMKATLLLPAGITSAASIKYKDEERLLANSCDAEETYVFEILPEKMKYNLKSLKEYSFWGDIKTIIATAIAVVKKDKKEVST